MCACFHVRATSDEHRRAMAKAAAAGVTLSELIRSRVFDDENRPLIQTDPERLQAIYANLRKAGGNLNQVVRLCNTRKQMADALAPELERALASVSQAAEDVSEFLADARRSI